MASPSPVRLRLPFALAAAALVAACSGAVGSAPSGSDAPPPAAGIPSGSSGFESYAGVPTPPFGIKEAAPSPPSPWTEEKPGFYYVDPSAPGASDSRAFGAASAPRATLPDPVPAGALVEAHGPFGDANIRCAGTASAPAFIVGAPGNTVLGAWGVTGSYCIVEKMNFIPTRNGEGSGTLGFSGDHLVARDNDLRGAPGETRSAALACGEGASDIVFYRNSVHDHGDVNASFDQDANGISVTAGSTRVWILDNETYRNSGDGINVNPYPYNEGNRNSVRFVYIAGNHSWGNKQTGVWAKMSSDIVVSTNTIHSHRGGNSSLGQCTGFQYGTERMWFVNNEIYDCDYGILIASDLGGADGKDTYIVGNVIHDIRDRDGTITGSAYSDAAIVTAGGTNRYIVNNTIQNVDAGIQAPYGGVFRLVNNVVSGVAPRGRHVFIEGRASVTAERDLFDAAPRLEGAACTSCIVGSPGFVDSAKNDYTLSATSSALNAGAPDDVYATFKNLYKLDLARDRNGVDRPQGPAWDIGAYERKP